MSVPNTVKVPEKLEQYLVEETKQKDVVPLINAVTDAIGKWDAHVQKKFFHCFLTQAFVTSCDPNCTKTFEDFKYSKDTQVNVSRKDKIVEMQGYMKTLYSDMEPFFKTSSFKQVSWSTLISSFGSWLLAVFKSHATKEVLDLEVLYSKVYLAAATPQDAIKEVEYRLETFRKVVALANGTCPSTKSEIAQYVKKFPQGKEDVKALIKGAVCLNPFHLKHNILYNTNKSTEAAVIFERIIIEIWNEGYGRVYKELTNKNICQMTSFAVKGNRDFWDCYNTMKWFAGEFRSMIGGGIKGGRIKEYRSFAITPITVEDKKVFNSFTFK